MRLCECRIFFLLFLAGAAPTTSPTTQMSDAELKDPAFWLRRAEVDWRQIASPLEKPWRMMAEQQLAAGDREGLKLTFAEFKRLSPSAAAKGDEYAVDHVAILYSEFAQYFAQARDDDGVKRVVAIANDRSRIKGQPSRYALDTLLERSAVSLARGGRDEEAITLANAIDVAQSRVTALIDIARETSKANRAASQKAMMAARRAAAAERDKSGGRARIAEALCEMGQLKEAAELATSLSDAGRASVEAQLASAYHRTGNQVEAKRHATLAVGLIQKVKWLDSGLRIRAAAQELACAGEPGAADAIRRLADEATSAPKSAIDLQAPSPTAGRVMLTSGQFFAIDAHGGLAVGFARLGQADLAREELKRAESVIQAVDPQPLAPNWYRLLHEPVIYALPRPTAAKLAMDLLRTDLKDEQLRSDFKRISAEMLTLSGNEAEAAPLWRELGLTSPPLYSLPTGSLRPELDRIAAQRDPRSRCEGYLQIAKLLLSAQPPTTSPAVP